MVTAGYVRNISDNFNLDIPSDIVSIIFMFYFMKLFNIEYGNRIRVKENMIRNVNYRSLNCPYLNTTVIGNWMNPNSDNHHTYTIKVKIRKKTGGMIIGIVAQRYDLYGLIRNLQGYSFACNGTYYNRRTYKGRTDKYDAGDIVSLTLNIKALSLSYSILKNEENAARTGILFKAGEIYETKYKWAVGIFLAGDSVEIIDAC